MKGAAASHCRLDQLDVTLANWVLVKVQSAVLPDSGELLRGDVTGRTEMGASLLSQCAPVFCHPAGALSSTM